MKKTLLAIGIIAAIAGVLLSVIPFIKVPDSSVWLNEAFSIPAGRNYPITTRSSPSFPSGVPLHITFEVAGTDSVVFRVMNEQNYQKYNSSQPFEYCVEPSRPSISRLDMRWVPPVNEKIYFVWDNSQGHISKSVSAYFSFDGPVIPPIWSTLGLLLVFGGLSTISYGTRPPTTASSLTSIRTGYVFATLGGIIGLILGLELLRKDNSEDKVHGKAILAIGAIALSTHLLQFLILSL